MPKLCDYQNCRKRATYGLKRDSPLRCKDHKDENMKLVCILCLCGKARACFNEPGETKAMCCLSCKTNTMINVKSKKCKCGKTAPTYNEPDKNLAICCSSCKTNTMINVKSRKCKCGKAVPTYNNQNEKKAICCKLCKTDIMVDIISKRCKCGKAQPLYNEKGETKAICCKICKTETMIDVLNKKCKCGKAQPTYNEKGETRAICCKICKTDTMINVKHTKCKCGKSYPIYNEPGKLNAICCSSCKTNSMINVISKRCKCGKARPSYNQPGQRPGICCFSCMSSNMIDVKHNKCPGLINNNEPCPYNTIANPKYKNYCTECYRRNFPLDPLTFQIRSKTKEIAVRDYINANLEGFQHDKPLSTSHCDCTVRRRIDHRKLINNTLLVIETDENQHKSYDQMDEETRYDDLYMAFSGKWIYIRFNPDKYVAKNGKNKNPMISTRLPVLLYEIKKQIKRIEAEENTELVERIYLYYDNYD